MCSSPLAVELDARTLAVDLERPSPGGSPPGRGRRRGHPHRQRPRCPRSGAWRHSRSKEIDRTLDVNLRAPIALAHGLVRGMMQRGRGHLLFMSSIAGKTAVPGDPLYPTTKFGLRGFASAAAGRSPRERRRCLGPCSRVHSATPVCSPTPLSSCRPGAGTRSPEDVARGVISAIEHNPWRGRCGLARPARGCISRWVRPRSRGVGRAQGRRPGHRAGYGAEPA